jgi:hypothetical protein
LSVARSKKPAYRIAMRTEILGVALLLAACSAKDKPTDLSAGGKFHVIPIEGGAAYLIDPTVQACFLVLPGNKPAGAISCHHLKSGVPAAEKLIPWETDRMKALNKEMEKIDAALAELPQVTKNDEAIAAGIKELGPNKYEISKSLLDQLLESKDIVRSARIVPSIRGGQPNGFRLFAIRPASFAAKIGLLNGDTINRVNEFELTTADQWLEIYKKIREAKDIKVEVDRRGEKVILEYTIK